jgi:DNA uptake protein ComE-like DNA-binding protein
MIKNAWILTLVGCVLASTVAGAQVGKSETLLYPNQASKEELAALPGLNLEIAEEIIENRPYNDNMELEKVLKEHLDEDAQKELRAKLFNPINLNAATEEEIKLVPGVGNKMAHEFLEYRPYENLNRFRREIGKYVDKDELARLEQFVFVPIDLNTASDEEILSIPGMGKRMLHEFKEYRPYEKIERFRREIGKYVDDDEVARLERYVTISK